MYEKHSRTHQNLKKIFNFFLNNTSIHGCTRIVSNKTSIFERRFWIMLNLISMVGSCILLKHLWDEYLTNPVLVTEDTYDIPVQKVSFPGVAVCNVNKISKKRAERFADYLLQNGPQDQRMRSKSELLEAIKLLGDLYDFNISDEERQIDFQIYLEENDNLTNIHLFKRITENVTFQLSQKCNEMLLKCVWGGIEYKCEELFKYRLTFDGPCCVFNYIRPVANQQIIKLNKREGAGPFKLAYARGAGVNNGLQLTLKDSTNDYFLTTTETKGYVIHIFNPRDFPDKSSGDLTEVIVNFNKETFISLDASVISGSEDIRILSKNMRTCIYGNEKKTIFGKYRQSDCLAECKVIAMESLCQCIPFTQPIDVTNYCTLTDLHCMNKFKTKWVSYFPVGEENLEALNFERQESINCPKCLPACSHEIYKVSVDVTDSETNSNHAYVNIFFNRPTGTLYTIDVQQTWYELVSSFGGYLSLLMGLSFISFVECLMLIYKVTIYFCQYLINHYVKSSKKRSKGKFLP